MASVAAVRTDGSVSVEQIENKIRASVYTKRLRVEEFFKDYDRLRSGFITRSQFRRALTQNIIFLAEEESDILAAKYDQNVTGMVNWKDFVECMESVFTQRNLEKSPNQAVREQQLFSPASLEAMDNVLQRILKHTHQNGINIKMCYSDFDRHHNGLITYNQFYRNFPGPANMTKEEMQLLINRYAHTESGGYVNYFMFHNEIVRLAKASSVETSHNTDNVIPNEIVSPTVASNGGVRDADEIEERLRVYIFKNRLRVIEFFRDYDKLHRGTITKNQFVCGLSLCRFYLTREEINALIQRYGTPNGEVEYRKFCDTLDSINTIRGLEKQPDVVPLPPSRDRLVQESNRLSDADEARVHRILDQLRQHVQTRRLLILPFFKDFDKGQGNTCRVTKNHFSRLLTVLSLEVPEDDLQILLRKYEDHGNSTDINYTSFIREVDINAFAPGARSTSPTTECSAVMSASAGRRAVKKPEEHINGADVLNSIRYSALINRIRVTEFFRDFDKLHRGIITIPQFRQGLSLMGFNLTNTEFEAILKPYLKDKHVLWNVFCDDINIVFTEKHLECSPTKVVPPQKASKYQSTVKAPVQVSEAQRALISDALSRFRHRISQRGIIVRPFFHDFDVHNNGHVTQHQFRQCLTYLGFHVSDAEVEACKAHYVDVSSGNFDYLAFVHDLDVSDSQTTMDGEPQVNGADSVSAASATQNVAAPTTNIDGTVNEALNIMRATSTNSDSNISAIGAAAAAESAQAKILEYAMHRIKAKVLKERLRVMEFLRDHDKLRKGRIPKTTFRRAIKPLEFGLTLEDFAVLDLAFESAIDPACVNYIDFSDEVESVFTIKGLEKAPDLEPRNFEPILADVNVINAEQEAQLKTCMHRLAEQVRTYRMILLPCFEDHDRMHIGTVSRNKFRSVLGSLGLRISEDEANAIYEFYNVTVGGTNEVMYVPFCRLVDEYSNTVWKG